jgi:hypothetical protein
MTKKTTLVRRAASGASILLVSMLYMKRQDFASLSSTVNLRRRRRMSQPPNRALNPDHLLLRHPRPYFRFALFVAFAAARIQVFQVSPLGRVETAAH